MKRAQRRFWRTVLTLLPLLATIGCWGSYDIQNQAYVTAIGLDFEKGQYNVYAQVLNFGNVARSEKSELGKPLPAWIGHTSGRTISKALNDMNYTSQFPLYWGHTKVVVVTERLLRERGVREVIRAINRYREVRYNIYVYGTKEKLTDILIRQSIFNLSPLDTAMFSPKEAYISVTGNRFIAKLDEPGNPAILPSIGLDVSAWSEEKKHKSMLRIDGGFFFTNDRMIAWMSEEDLKGSRWAQPSLRDTEINIPLTQPLSAGIVVVKSKFKIKPRLLDGRPKFDVEVKTVGHVVELFEDVSVARLEEIAGNALRSQIQETFRKGVAVRCDPFALQQSFYRKYPRIWKALGGANEYQLRPDSIDRIDVKMKLTHMGKYKGRVN